MTILQSLPGEIWVLLAVALIVSAVGFYRYVYFISIGYGFSILAMALTALLLFRADVGLLTMLQCLLLGAYGLRLGLFLYRRERQAAAYRRELAQVERHTAGVPLIARIATWIVVCLLYVLMFAPALFNMAAGRAAGATVQSPVQVMGLVIMAAGLLLEALADQQKSAYKQDNPDRYCDTGLFRVVRYPNYLGEILFWVGNFSAGLTAYVTGLHWLLSIIGLVGIVLIMVNSTINLERKQGKRYGDRADYQTYTHQVPVLIPLIPLYTLQKIGSLLYER